MWQFSGTSGRISAEPTMPRWPATNMRRPFSGKRVGSAMLSIVRGGASARVVKPGLAHGSLAPREVDIVLDHHLDQLCEGNPRLPAENLPRLGGIAAQRLDPARPARA